MTDADITRNPLLKREISLRRKAKAAPETRPNEQKSLLKRHPSLARKPKPESIGKPPRRLAQRSGSRGVTRLVGLKVGASQIAAAEVVNNGEPEVVQLARRPLEPGVVVGGVLREPELLGAALAEFFSANKLPRRGVRLGVGNNRIGVRLFEVAGIEEPRQLGNAVRFKAQEMLPIPIEEAVLDYRVLSERVDEEGVPIRRVLLVVAYRELIDRYLAACRIADVKLAGIDLEAFAILRALEAPGDGSAQPSDAARVIVAAGHDRSTFALKYGGVCEFTRVLDWGGAALDAAVARTLDITPAESAEPIKRALGLEGEATPSGVDDLTEAEIAQVHAAVREQVQKFARELVSSLQFYQKQPGSHGIGELVLTGGTAQLPGLSGELQGLIGVPVRVGNPLGRVKLASTIKEPGQLGSFAVAIGLGIED